MRYRPLAFFATLFAATWIPLFGAAAVSFREDGRGPQLLLLVLAGLAPLATDLVFTYRTGGRALLREYAARVLDLRRIPSRHGWLLVTLMPALAVAAVVGSLPFGGSLGELRLGAAFLASPVTFTAFVFVFGPLPEELGWRGYGIESLRERSSLFRSSLVLGLAWSLWHVPLFFVNGSYQRRLLEEPAYATVAFFLGMLPLTFVIHWLYVRCRASTLSAIVLHFMGNWTGEALQLSQRSKAIEQILLAALASILLIRERALFFAPPPRATPR